MIIDGRIADIYKTHLEGVLVILILCLRNCSSLRTLGFGGALAAEGLDILNSLQKNRSSQSNFYDGDFDDVPEVDSKLIRLAKLIDAAVV